jgi:ABC-type cobalamin/Fe3+-siderophores transport system ATPase subunit
MATMKSAMTTKVPAPKNQGSMGSSASVTQGTKIQPKLGPNGTGKSTVLYSKQPSGTKGSNKGAK